MDHDCLILKNKFQDKHKYYCHICGRQYGLVEDIKEELLLDLYNFLMDETYIITSAESVMVWVTERLKEIKK